MIFHLPIINMIFWEIISSSLKISAKFGGFLDKTKQLGIQVKTLDDAVKAAIAKAQNNNDQNPANSNLLFQEASPWSKPVDIKDLILELIFIFDRFAILPRYSTLIILRTVI